MSELADAGGKSGPDRVHWGPYAKQSVEYLRPIPSSCSLAATTAARRQGGGGGCSPSGFGDAGQVRERGSGSSGPPKEVWAPAAQQAITRGAPPLLRR